MPLSDQLRQRIDGIVRSHRVVLFMKGSRRFPQCGFSASVVQILDKLLPSYETVNILTDPELREGMKLYTEWPTFPQLYIDSSFVGGSDIVRDMFTSGELAALVGSATPAAAASSAPAPAKPPAVTITPGAARALAAAGGEGGDVIRLEISGAFQHDLFFGPPAKDDVVVESNGAKVHFDAASAARAEGLSIDYVTGPSGAGFKLDNPGSPPAVQQASAAEVKAMMADGQPVHVFDVRTAEEVAKAKIEGSLWLGSPEAAKKLEELVATKSKERVVFQCHHGGRSQRAAEHYLAQGLSRVFNLRGGIHAWSAEVDPTVPTY
jgi:monothiol glutaredoxin